MKKLFSLFFLFVFLFNVAGYYIVYLGWRYQARTEMVKRLDEQNYSDEETITIKIPFNLPYQVDGRGYERMKGEFEYEGEFYKIAKQKMEKDTLYIVCVKDIKEKKIFSFMTGMVKFSTEGHASSIIKHLNSVLKDFVSTGLTVVLSQQGWSLARHFAEVFFNLISNETTVPSPPPDYFYALS